MIIVFSGAGASKGVKPAQYPTTVEFFDRLPDDVKQDELFKLFVQYLEHFQKDRGPLDIEQILWLAHELGDFTSRAANSKNVAGWFLLKDRLASISGMKENLRALHTLPAAAAATSHKIDNLSTRINALVHELYGDPPKKEDLESNWVPLLKGLVETSQAIELVTTNYDIVLEEAIPLCNVPVLTGRTTGNQPTLDPTLWDLRGLSVDKFVSMGRLTKLHGSVDWVRGKNRIHVGTPLFQGDDKRHAIIYPGFKGTPADPLFQRFHRYFQSRLAEADIVIFVGYAFRDEYINAILERDSPHDVQIIVLNPAERLPLIPFAESRFVHVKKNFDLAGVTEVLNSIREGQSDSPEPA